MDGLSWKTLLKWMIWGYQYFRKHPLAEPLSNLFPVHLEAMDFIKALEHPGETEISKVSPCRPVGPWLQTALFFRLKIEDFCFFLEEKG